MPGMLPGAGAGMPMAQMSQLPLLQHQTQISPTAAAAAQYQTLADYAAYGAAAGYPGEYMTMICCLSQDKRGNLGLVTHDDHNKLYCL